MAASGDKLYVLKCENGRFYVGRTKDVQKRFEEHLAGYNGAAWTKEYIPLQIVLERPYDAFDEDKYVKKYMLVHGISRVRGGTYCQIDLSPEELQELARQLNSERGKCLYCGKHGHFLNKCRTYYSDKMKSGLQTENYLVISRSKTTKCSICSRFKHSGGSCYATTTWNGERINESPMFPSPEVSHISFAL